VRYMEDWGEKFDRLCWLFALVMIATALASLGFLIWAALGCSGQC